MRMHYAKPHGWGWVAAISALALLVVMLGLALVQGGVRAAGTFDPQVTAELSDTAPSEAGAPVNADITTEFNIPAEDYNYAKFYAFTPEEFFPTDSEPPPIGDVVGSIGATAVLGLLNGPCNPTVNSLPVTMDMLWGSTDPNDTITFAQQFADVSPANGIKDGAEHYPDFVARILPGLTPLERHIGLTNLSGNNVSVNIMTLPAGSLGFPTDWGRPSVLILNEIGDPGGAATPSTITDFCAPLLTQLSTFGRSESGAEVRRNPSCGENPFSFRWYAESMVDADGDGLENYIDTCPFVVNTESPKDVAGDLDGDGIDGGCEPAGGAAVVCWPGAPGYSLDCDGDNFYNRGDNCPIVANATQVDADADDIGDVCDPNPGTADGTAVIAQPPDLQINIDIDDIEACPAEGETATATATATPTATATGTAPATGTPTPAAGTATPTTVAGEGCAPVIPGTYNGLVRLNGAPAAAGYEVTAVIDGTEWGSAIVSGGRYALDVPQKLPAAEPCFAGGTITFQINGATCEPTEEWASGLRDVDLSCAAVPTVVPPTVPPGTPTVPTTPVVTPVKPPSTGGGGLGGPPDGLPLWALTLAGWAALTAVAGFGTLAARMRKP